MNDPWGNRGCMEQDALRCVVHITSEIVVEGSDAAEHNESSVIQGARNENRLDGQLSVR